MELKYSRFIVLLFVLKLFFYCSETHGQNYGIKFQGHDFTLDERTEINLTPREFLKFQDEFELSFGYKPDVQPNSSFGCVFRLISQNNFNVDLISTPIPSNETSLELSD